MTCRLFPPLPADAARTADLQRLIEAAAVAHAKLSPVDKALAAVAQMQSYVRGDLAIDGDGVPRFNDAASILAAEVVALRAQLAAAICTEHGP